MKHLILTLTLAASAFAAPAMAFSVDTSSLTPVLTFPEPAPEPVTQGAGQSLAVAKLIERQSKHQQPYQLCPIKWFKLTCRRTTLSIN